MSALANLAGLYPPTTNEIWNDHLDWQPIPVHTIPRNSDYILSASKNCPKYQVAYQKYLDESPEVQRIYNEHADIFPELTQLCGANITTITDVFWLYDTYQIELDNNLPLVAL